MAKIYYNKKQHLVIQINFEEAKKLNFGIPISRDENVCVCDTCNQCCKEDEMFYVAGINRLLCKECAEDYCDNMTHYTDTDSIKYEVRHFNYVAVNLGIEERAVITPDGKVIICNKDLIDDLNA